MSCFYPITAFRNRDGQIVFRDRGEGELQLPCGRCFGCRLEKSRQWAMRCIHEASLHDENCFVTLTYDDEKLIRAGRAPPVSLEHRDFQLFMKRLVRKVGPVRYYMSGEYGDENLRPHYHALLFGYRFACSRKVSSDGRYDSQALTDLWQLGNTECGEVTFESAAYVARYIMKKITGPEAEEHYKRVDPMTGEIVQVEPEYSRMSNGGGRQKNKQGGIGYNWIRLYKTDVYRGDDDAYVVVNGMKCKPPRYYDQYVSETSEYEGVQYHRYKNSLMHREDGTPERLAVREKVARARLSFKKRGLK